MADKINAEKNLQEFKSIGMTQVQISSRKVEKKITQRNGSGGRFSNIGSEGIIGCQ